MKLAQGEYVALEKIENAYSASPMIAQIYVHGDSLQDHLIAIVIPDTVQLAGIASKLAGKHVRPEDAAALEAAARDERVHKAIMTELTRQAKKVGLKGFESVRKIHVSLEPFTPENDTLTPTLKIKRYAMASTHSLSDAHVHLRYTDGRLTRCTRTCSMRCTSSPSVPQRRSSSRDGQEGRLYYCCYLTPLFATKFTCVIYCTDWLLKEPETADH
jgi:hypothetical protein